MADDPIAGPPGYEPLQRVGRGAMGPLLRARREATGAIVALRLLDEVLADDPGVRRSFLREAAAVAAVEHPAIGRVVDHGELDDGRPWLATEWVGGTSLARLAGAAGALPPARVAGIVEQLGAGLDAVHAVGLVHGDVRPANVLIESTGGRDRVRLVDFGGARTMAATTLGPRTLGGDLEDPAYLAPERITGSEAGAESDRYALGCLLVLLLTGRPAFSGGGVIDVARAQAEGPRPRPSVMRRELGTGYDDLVVRALAIDPEARPASGGLLAAELRAAAGASPATAAPASPATTSEIDLPLTGEHPRRGPRRGAAPTTAGGPSGAREVRPAAAAARPRPPAGAAASPPRARSRAQTPDPASSPSSARPTAPSQSAPTESAPTEDHPTGPVAPEAAASADPPTLESPAAPGAQSAATPPRAASAPTETAAATPRPPAASPRAAASPPDPARGAREGVEPEDPSDAAPEPDDDPPALAQANPGGDPAAPAQADPEGGPPAPAHADPRASPAEAAPPWSRDGAPAAGPWSDPTSRGAQHTEPVGFERRADAPARPAGLDAPSSRGVAGRPPEARSEASEPSVPDAGTHLPGPSSDAPVAGAPAPPGALPTVADGVSPAPVPEPPVPALPGIGVALAARAASRGEPASPGATAPARPWRAGPGMPSGGARPAWLLPAGLVAAALVLLLVVVVGAFALGGDDEPTAAPPSTSAGPTTEAAPPPARTRADATAVLRRFAAAYSSRDGEELGRTLARDVARRGQQASGGCATTRGRDAVVGIYTAQFAGGTGAYAFPGLRASRVRVTGSTARVTNRYEVVGGGSGRVRLRLEPSSGALRITRIDLPC